jgi:hypothetical protein
MDSKTGSGRLPPPTRRRYAASGGLIRVPGPPLPLQRGTRHFEAVVGESPGEAAGAMPPKPWPAFGP